MHHLKSMNANETKKIEVGDLVTVKAPYNNPPDAWTGRIYRVVAVRVSFISGVQSCALAPSNLVGVDESDEVVEIVTRRLERVGAWEVRS